MADDIRAGLQKRGVHIDLCLEKDDDITQIINNDTFIIIIYKGINDDIISKLHSAGKVPMTDYINVYHDIRISECIGYYRDVYYNEIIAGGNLEKCNIRFKGWNSKVVVGRNTKLTGNIEINLGSSCVVNIGDNVAISEGSVIRCEDDSTVSISANCVFGQSKIISQNRIDIGANGIFNDGLILICDEGTYIRIGEQALMASNVHIRSGNGHSLFDLESKENISEKSEYVIIGNHVWIGQDVTILFNTELSDDCVVGAKSLVKKKHEKQSLVAGVPAKTIRQNVSWSIDKHMTYEAFEAL